MTWTSAVHVGQETRSCQAGRQDQGTACLTTVQIGSHVLNSVDSQCSLTDFSFWKRKGHLEGTCSSPSIGFRLKNIVAVCSNWAWGDVATHMSAPGHGYIFQVVHHMTLSRNKSQCLLGACRVDNRPLTSPWPRYRGYHALDVIGSCVVCVLFSPLVENNNSSNSIINKTQMSAQTFCSLSSSRFLHFSRG